MIGKEQEKYEFDKDLPEVIFKFESLQTVMRRPFLFVSTVGAARDGGRYDIFDSGRTQK